MVELSPTSPCHGLLPRTIGGVTLREEDPGAIHAILLRQGQAAALDNALRTAHGVGWPDPGQALSSDQAACVWTGRGSALLMGPAPHPGLSAYAGVSDQSDAWAVVSLSGPAAEAVLARLCPVDLRIAVFPVGATARTLCQHMTVSVTRQTSDTFQILAFRSMAATLVHDVTEAARSVAARGALA